MFIFSDDIEESTLDGRPIDLEDEWKGRNGSNRSQSILEPPKTTSRKKSQSKQKKTQPKNQLPKKAQPKKAQPKKAQAKKTQPKKPQSKIAQPTKNVLKKVSERSKTIKRK